MGALYGTNDLNVNDEAAKKDDEYADGPYCRFDDIDAKAANEWKGTYCRSLIEYYLSPFVRLLYTD